MHHALESGLREMYGNRLDRLLSEEETADLDRELARLEGIPVSRGASASSAPAG